MDILVEIGMGRMDAFKEDLKNYMLKAEAYLSKERDRVSHYYMKPK